MALAEVINAKGQNCAQENGTFSCRGPMPYPNCWNDAKRMEVLFAPFRQRDVNPENYDSKMKFWTDMIELYCLYTGSVVISKAALQIAFTHGAKIPYCLDAVIAELYRTKKIRLCSEYEGDPLNGWKSWAVNGLVWRPLSWGVNKLKSKIGKYQEAQTEYIHLAAVDKFCKKLHDEVMVPEVGKIMAYTAFKKLTDEVHVHLKEKTLRLCLITLECQKKLTIDFIYKNNDWYMNLIKIPASNDAKPHEISQTDQAMYQLQLTQSTLHRQLEDFEAQIIILDKKVRQLVNDDKRGLAKTYLRKKHLLERNHAKRAQALQNIEELMNGVEEARSHGQILDAYKIGSQALQQVLNASGLKYDKVDEVVADVRETLDANRDIEDALANASSRENILGDSEDRELELELRDIINEEALIRAPAVPQHIPGTLSPQRTVADSLTVTIKDAELLAMLDQLELEESTPPSNNTAKNNDSRIFS